MLVPEGFDGFLAQLELRLEEPEFIDPAERGQEAEARERDNPRIEELATAMADHHLANPALLGNPAGRRAWTKASAQYRLISDHRGDQAPVSARLAALTEAGLRCAGVLIPRR
ncbi:hypothetical protein [Kitasatospora sp. NPDC058190]|uniref:hypothetical protein n=1 Tax=Kitasatospora sp. NPDC058190 TaxID=3346371 RepID=UPI0036DD0F60